MLILSSSAANFNAAHNMFLLQTFNPFVPNASFLYPLKRSENRKIFLCFQGVDKGCIGNKWAKTYLAMSILHKKFLKILPKANIVLSFSQHAN